MKSYSPIPGILGETPIVPPCPVKIICSGKKSKRIQSKEKKSKARGFGYNRMQKK